MTSLPQLPQSESIGDVTRAVVRAMNEGRYSEAKVLCEQLRRSVPREPDVYNLLGGIEYQLRNPAAAIKHFQKVLKLKPEHDQARTNLGKVQAEQGEWRDAERAFGYVAKRQPGNARVMVDWARSLAKLGRSDEAINAYVEALSAHPSPDAVEAELAGLLLDLGRTEDAERHYVAVLSRNAAFVPALLNLALIRDQQDRMEEALSLQDRAVAADPNSAEAHFHHALAMLTRGRLAEGWPEYAWRFARPQTTTLHDLFKLPYWDGTPLGQKRLVIWTEQGPGDEILMASMIPDIGAAAGQCTLICTQRLAPLFRRSFPHLDVRTREEVVATGAKMIHADVQASLSQLGTILRPSLEAFPVRPGYLAADPAATAALRQKYRTDGMPLVGIAWRSANLSAEKAKSTSLTEWSEILLTPGVRFVSLQYGDHADEIAAARKQTGASIIEDPAIDGLKDIDAFAAQVAAVDLVISVSSTTVHVAGGLGIPAWTLVPASHGRIWYWFLQANHSPWYPSMRLFRQQPTEATWSHVLGTVARDLRQWRP